MKILKRFIILILLVLGAGTAIILYLNHRGHDIESIRELPGAIKDIPNKIDLTIGCSDVENALIAATVGVTVKNNSSRIHKNVYVRVTGFDKNGKKTKSKEVGFVRTFGSYDQFTKVITLPARTRTCKCVITKSSPS